MRDLLDIVEAAEGPRRIPPLQHFEYALMRIAAADEDAYAAGLARALSDRLGVNVSLAQVVVALDRLAAKGFVTLSQSAPRPVQGGRARKLVGVTIEGMHAVDETRDFYVNW